MADTAKTVENLDRQRLDALAKGDYAKADRLSREAYEASRNR